MNINQLCSHLLSWKEINNAGSKYSESSVRFSYLL